MLSATSDDNYTANSITEQDGGGWFADLFKRPEAKTPERAKTQEELEYDTAELEYNKVAAEFNEIIKYHYPSTPEYKEVQTKIQDATRKFDNTRLKLNKKSPEEEAKIRQRDIEEAIKNLGMRRDLRF